MLIATQQTNAGEAIGHTDAQILTNSNKHEHSWDADRNVITRNCFNVMFERFS